ncbi:MAG: PD40 domain-containing protein, partial [Anaerolineae bacterium]|nr:PD40 domain-containing protein [Anaerolineae bacterium]
TINADGRGRVQLTNNGDYDDEPDWSPGGNQIVFTRGRYGFNTDIWVMNADGSNPRQLTTDEATDHSPRWLPDGRIMFVSERERAGAIYVMYADGSNVQAITAPLGVLTFDYWKGGL